MSLQKLPHYTELQQRPPGRDTAWVKVANPWANVKYGSGMSAIKSGADTSITKASIRIRHRTIDAGMRILFDGKVFDIQAVLPDGKRQFIDLVCEVVNGGANG